MNAREKLETLTRISNLVRDLLGTLNAEIVNEDIDVTDLPCDGQYVAECVSDVAGVVDSILTDEEES